MENISNKLDQIELKVRQLALKIERLEKTNANLLEENEQLKLVAQKGNSKLSNLEERLKKTQAVVESKRKEEPDNTKRVRRELERYIKEIDKCIEWLSKE